MHSQTGGSNDIALSIIFVNVSLTLVARAFFLSLSNSKMRVYPKTPIFKKSYFGLTCNLARIFRVALQETGPKPLSPSLGGISNRNLDFSEPLSTTAGRYKYVRTDKDARYHSERLLNNLGLIRGL